MAQVGVDEYEKRESVPELKDEEDVLDEELWTSRWSFILAAVGSAIGLGNFWRFPFLAFKWGGPFLFPYLFALFTVGIPLMQLEMAMGQVFRRAATQAFGMLDPRFRGLGLGAGMVAFGVVAYYQALLSWGNVYFINSFKEKMPWDITGLKGENITGVPTDFFFNEVLRLGSGDSAELNEIVIPNLIGTLFQWLCVLLILLFGTEFISKAVWVTVLMPVVMLLVLIITGARLEGAGKGVEQYLGKWDFELLSNGEMWVDAFGQIFFSLSLSVGVMPAYAAMNPRNADIIKDATIVSILNCSFSLLAGFAVFTVAGYLSNESGIPFTSDDPDALVLESIIGGVKLAFIAYPAGLSLVGGAGAKALCAMFFITFFFLGIDSAFSLVEAVVMNFRETKFFAKFTKKQFTIMVCLAGTIWSIIYCSDKGLHFLDIVDNYIAGFGLLLFGFLESIVAAWVYKRQEAIERVGSTPVLVLELGYWGGVCSFIGLAFALGFTELEFGAVFGISFAVGIVQIVLGLVGSWVLAKKNDPSVTVKDVYFFGVSSLIDYVNEAVTEGKPGNWKFSLIWCATMKFFVGPCLLFLLMQKTTAFASGEGLADYTLDLEMMGIVLLFISITLFVVGFFAPHLYEEPSQHIHRKTVL